VAALRILLSDPFQECSFQTILSMRRKVVLKGAEEARGHAKKSDPNVTR